ncbi:hypothetical protein H072_189 [Dactylellina haptotyla CBS 200.50]|uniref:F-box domain-containing protein n=1 Tax=Dactylellina haptotyla (strain CBS 200.50) TaxID=1284197 RepID=S8C1V7_DACHA|nr:hypothetical protein H072_189 [Dactylellina haptotyla CBS 200.50]
MASQRPSSRNLLSLPVEIQAEILSYLPFEELVLASGICKLWYEIFNETGSCKVAKYSSDGIHNLLAGYNRVVFVIGGDILKKCYFMPLFAVMDDAEMRWIDISECKVLDEKVLCRLQSEHWKMKSNFFVYQKLEGYIQGYGTRGKPITVDFNHCFTVRQLVNHTVSTLRKEADNSELGSVQFIEPQELLGDLEVEFSRVRIKEPGILSTVWCVTPVESDKKGQ